MEAYITSLSNSFRQVPPASVPAMLDCILASTASSPLSLFSSLLDTFPNITKDVINSSEKLDSEQCNYLGSFVGALCHLLKKSGADLAALESFIWRILLPLMKLLQVYDHAIKNEALGSFFNVVVETNSWAVVEATLVPYFLRLVGLSMGMPHSEELAIYRWSTDESLAALEINKDYRLSQSGSFLLQTSCHILSLIFDAALETKHTAKSAPGSILASGHSIQVFTQNLLWDLCNMTIQMVLQSSEHRSCAITFFLPLIFKTFVSDHAFQISVCSQMCMLSRVHFFMKIWKCCKTLFSLGTSERRDAYSVLSLYISFFPCIDGHEDVEVGGKNDAFDLRAEKEFWDEMKRGLVDKEGLVRKQSLHILKMILHASAENQQDSGGILEKMSNEKSSAPGGMTKRGRWADKEAKSLGVGKIFDSVDFHLNSQQKWGAFFLLYEMLEEYGTHLVEAAWNHQITLLLHKPFPCDNFVNPSSGGLQCHQMETLVEIFNWLAVLWERGFCHDNPQVRCLIMQSFLGIEWTNYGNCATLVPEDFLLGPFIQALNDPVHHKDFGIKGVYSSRTIEGTTKFLRQYTSILSLREKISFLINLASVAKKYSFGRAGLMSFAECIASAAVGVHARNCAVEQCKDTLSAAESSFHNDKAELLDVLRFIMESSKQHFNHNYRLKVCEKILDAAASVMHVIDVPLELLLQFVSTLPQESMNYGGSLRVKVQEWLRACDGKHCTSTCCIAAVPLLKSLDDFPRSFINLQYSEDVLVTYDDEDLDIWELQTKRWARVLFLVIKEEHDLDPALMFFQNHAIDLCKEISHLKWLPIKFLILILSVVLELRIMKEKTTDRGKQGRNKLELSLPERESHLVSTKFSNIFGKYEKLFALILGGVMQEELVSFARLSTSVFWSNMAAEDTNLPGSIRGKLGGPSQRRLSSSITTAILQAITSIKALASISSWCAQFRTDVSVDSALTFLWQLCWKIIRSSTCNSETEAETCVAAYEALARALKELVSVFSPLALDLLMENYKSSQPNADSKKPLLDSFVRTFLQNINNVIAVGNMVRTRRAVLINWKWICLESLLSIPNYAIENGVELETCNSFFSDVTVRWIFGDLVDSLENASEGSVMPMLRSIRLVLELFAFGRKGSIVSLCDGVDAQMMWNLVHSSWILHISCNKRRVAPIAALLSAVIHHSVFSEEGMHEIDNNAPGPLKWLVEKILEEGTRSPRTIRLAALHLTGLWLSNPNTIKYYMKELKQLTLYGSVAFDEDFEAELHDNSDARSEVSILAKSPDPELTEVFINTELYARVSVAVLFDKLADLADMIGSKNENEDNLAALQSGKMFLLELLDTAVNDKDLAKELYKKYSAIHRRKVRVWQMICILSRFIDQDIVQKVTSSLHVSLYRTNLPAVRQYLETFAIYIYLKFPSLVGEQLVPLLRNYDMRPQALSSYVFIAANVILHATKEVQSRHLDELLPPIIPLLTSHHHTLRGFTQLLVYQVLSKLLPDLDSSASGTLSLEKRCFVDLKSYLEDNSDCSRLRASMEGYLDDFNPKNSITPAGIFTNRIEETEFECVPTSLMEQVVNFLNDAREDLRCSMAKDADTLKNEHLKADENPKSNGEELLAHLTKDTSLDFQKKITLYKHENQATDSGFLFGNNGTYKSLMEMGKEDQVLDQLLHSRSVAVEKLRAGRQQFILVASLLDRIPNLAGLARTCEVFKASTLAIADKNVLHDKQFQLISVTAEKWVPIVEVPVSSVKIFLEKKKREGFSILGLEQTANSIPLDQYTFPKKTVLVLGREKEGIPVELIHILDACIEIPQLGVVRSLNVHVSGAIALWEYTRQQRPR